MSNPPSASDDIIDSRDVIARIDELTDERSDLQSAIDDAESDESRDAAVTALADWTADYGDELAALESLADEAGDGADWTHGETLIRDSYFTDYARELLEDCDALPANLPGYIVIDWDATAANIQVDYTPITFDGIPYWIRS